MPLINARKKLACYYAAAALWANFLGFALTSRRIGLHGRLPERLVFSLARRSYRRNQRCAQPQLAVMNHSAKCSASRFGEQEPISKVCFKPRCREFSFPARRDGSTSSPSFVRIILSISKDEEAVAIATATMEQRSGKRKCPQPEGTRLISPDHFVHRPWGIPRIYRSLSPSFLTSG